MRFFRSIFFRYLLVLPGLDFGVHDSTPEGGEQGEEEHGGVAGGELGAIFEVAEGGVGARGVGVVVGVSGEVEEEGAGDAVGGVPGVFGLDSFEAAVGELLAAEAVVFEVVDEFEEEDCDEALGEEELQGLEAEGV